MQFTKELEQEYLSLWEKAKIQPEHRDAVVAMAERVLRNKSRYEAVAAEFGCPWWWIGMVHAMEGSCNFGTWLANGDPLPSPTVHVPKGLRCSGTWEDGARVSLQDHGMPKDAWSLARCFYEWERYNGWGYRSHGDVSDYLWSFTDQERAGRYVADSEWDPSAWSDQPSCGAMLRYLVEKGAVSLSQTNPQPTGVDDRVTLLELHRLEEGGSARTGCVGYAGADALVTWDGSDKSSLIQFMQRFKNAATVQVAPASKAWPTLQPPRPAEVFLKLQRTGQVEDKGCEVLLLTMEGTGKSWYCRSGQPYAQVFQQGGSSNRPGSMMPLPAGEYSVGNIEFAGFRDDYSTSHGEGLGPVWIPVEPKFSTARGSFGIHLDAGAYGTAGCIGLRSIEDVKSLVATLRQYDPKRLQVAW